MMKREFDFYKAHQDELLAKCAGKYVVIVGETVVGSYDSEMEAFLETKKKYEVGTFLIQHCLPVDELKQTFHSRVSFPGSCNPL